MQRKSELSLSCTLCKSGEGKTGQELHTELHTHPVFTQKEGGKQVSPFPSENP